MLKTDRSLSKVVIPVAGLGTRFLPVTKAVPKELLPIVDKPIIHFIVEEAVRAGFETVVFVMSRPKISVSDYFDPGDLSAFKLAEANKGHLIEDVLALTKKIDIVSVRQTEARGLGHAILQAHPVVSGQNFAVILGDDIVSSKGESAIAQCRKQFEALDSGSVIGVVEVPEEETQKYGIVDLDSENRIRAFVEKPKPSEAPSRWAMPGRYIFEPEILDSLRETPPGKGNEIQLTDAMQRLLAKKPFYAEKIKGERFDTGDKLGYIMANVAFALDNPQFKDALSSWLKKKLET